MKTLPLILLFCSLAQIARTQPCAQFAQIRNALQSAYDAGLFREALEQVKALRACDPSSAQEADLWIGRIFAEMKENADIENAGILTELKQSKSRIELMDARICFDKSLTYKTLAALKKAEGIWNENAEVRVMLDSMADYCPDWMALSSGYTGLNKNNKLIGYFDESTEHRGLCDYVVRNILSGDTLVFRQVSKVAFFSMAAEFSRDGEKIVYHTSVDSTEYGTINIYDSRKKKTFQFADALLSENWMSDNGRTFVFLKDIPGDKNYQQLCVFDFETESLQIPGKSVSVYGDWRFWISPDGENVIYCTKQNPNTPDFGTFCLYNLKNKVSLNFEDVFLHGPEFSADSRYLSIKYSDINPGPGSLINLETGKAQKAIIYTTFIEGYAGPVAISTLKFEPERTISQYTPLQKTWVETPMPQNLTKQSDVILVGDMLLYTFTNNTTGWPCVGVYQHSKHRDFVFSDGYLESMRLFRIAQGLNNSKDLCFISNSYDGIVRSYDFTNGQTRDFKKAVALDNHLRRENLGFTTDNGDWIWMLTRKPADADGFDLTLANRDGNTTVIDSGYFSLAFFTRVVDQNKLVYVQNTRRGAKDQTDIVLYDPNTRQKTRLSAFPSNQLSASNREFTDLWVDEDRHLMVYSTAPKTFCIRDLALNKSIRSFKIEQEYQDMELRGQSGLLEIRFKNGVKKWIRIDVPAKPLQWHLDQLRQ